MGTIKYIAYDKNGDERPATDEERLAFDLRSDRRSKAILDEVCSLIRSLNRGLKYQDHNPELKFMRMTINECLLKLESYRKPAMVEKHEIGE